MAEFRLKNVMDGKEIHLDNTILTVGRDADCDIILEQEQGFPSRKHAQVIIQNGELVIEDLQSTNGTFVNNVRIETPTKLKAGDIVKFATAEFSIVDSQQGDETIISGRISPSIKKDSYFVMEEDFDPEKTAIRQHYPLPSGWPVDNTFSRALFESKSPKKEAQEIDQIIEDKLSDQDDIFIAALVFKSDSMDPVVHGISLNEKTSKWSIGRNPECDIVIDLPSVSERHANLYFFKKQWIIEDNRSTNGIRYEGKQTTEVILTAGTKISLGQVSMYFREIKLDI